MYWLMISQQLILIMTDVMSYVLYILDVVADVIAKDVMAIMPCDRCYSYFY